MLGSPAEVVTGRLVPATIVEIERSDSICIDEGLRSSGGIKDSDFEKNLGVLATDILVVGVAAKEPYAAAPCISSSSEHDDSEDSRVLKIEWENSMARFLRRNVLFAAASNRNNRSVYAPQRRTQSCVFSSRSLFQAE
jgi:hypothetical protein